jgi:chemotaxis protein CheD
VTKPKDIVEVLLEPGEFYFGDRSTRIRTLLGSCVAISLWHPRALIGGMCHYMMPGGHPATDPQPLNGRYAADAVEMFLREVAEAGTMPQEYVAKVFGGGNQFPGWSHRGDGGGLPNRNIEAALSLLVEHHITVTATHLGGNGHRQVIFDVWSGDVWMKHNTGNDW